MSWADFWPFLVAYTFAVAIAHFSIKWVVDWIWRKIGWSGTTTPHPGQGYLWRETLTPAVLGFVERALYVGSIHFGRPEFIGVWLALKTAGGLKSWSEDVVNPNNGILVAGRTVFTIFLIGNGLSLMYAFVGAQLVDWLNRDWWNLTVSILGFLTLLSAWAALPCIKSWLSKGAHHG